MRMITTYHAYVGDGYGGSEPDVVKAAAFEAVVCGVVAVMRLSP
jgi:hypothetical protein